MNIHEQPHCGNGANTPAWDQTEYDDDISRVAALPEERWAAEIALLLKKYKAFDIGRQLLKKHIKEAHARVAKMERDKARKAREEAREASAAGAAPVAKVAGVRPRILAPYPDGPRAGVMRLLDKMLTTDEAEPPMRDLYWALTEPRMSAPVGVHLLTSESANAEEEAGCVKRLPPPPILSLIPHEKYSLGLLIEKHVEFYKLIEKKNGDIIEVTVALPQPFIEAYLAYRDSNLPRVWTIATMPMVLPNGKILATNGLDRKSKILFHIEPGIVELLPKGEITDADILAAMNFLADEWLCDVLTDYDGKCVLISMAMSILQRTLFRERPCFSVTAGKAEGGKTTAVNMVCLAALGIPAPAAAWSMVEEERRKALFALARQGLAFVAWDNIKRGAAISCPHFEKMLTAEIIGDRVLGTSDNETPPSLIIFVFTGNDITMKGDLASRTLLCRIVVDRPDPANREFKHPAPLEWTRDHRAEILKALYVIMMGNPRAKQAKKDRKPAKTRFKDWWASIGAAIEHAAKLAGHEVDFDQLIALSKSEDEETLTLVDGLRALDTLATKNNSAASYTASLVRGWADDYGTEPATLKNFLKPRRDGTLTTPMVTATLGSHTDEPVDVGDEIWILKAKRDPHTEVKEYRIEKRKRKAE